MEQITRTRSAVLFLAVSLAAMGVGQLLLSFGRDFMLVAVEWVRLSAWAAGLYIVGAVLNGIGAATRVDGITLVSFAIMLAGLGGLFTATSGRPRTAAPTAVAHR